MSPSLLFASTIPQPRRSAERVTDEPFLFVVGGARCGKSEFAVEAGRRCGRPVTFIATATAGDDDMKRRIERHRQDRPDRWAVVEEPLHLARAVQMIDPDDGLIVDCLTMWTANMVFDGRDDDEVVAEAQEVGASVAERDTFSVVVSNEVGLGIHPVEALGRRYQNLLGRVNRAVADHASSTLFFVAGQALALHDPWALVDEP